MKTKIVLGVLAGVVLLTPVMFPQVAQAFWPFDGWFQNKVKGVQTDTRPNQGFSISNIFKRVTPTPTPVATVSGESQAIEDVLTTDKLNTAVQGRILTATQRAELMVKLAEIRAKRAELKKLLDLLAVWLRNNGLDQKRIGDPKPATSSGTPHITPNPDMRRPQTTTVQPGSIGR